MNTRGAKNTEFASLLQRRIRSASFVSILVVGTLSSNTGLQKTHSASTCGFQKATIAAPSLHY